MRSAARDDDSVIEPDDQDRPEIRVRTDGPYLVRGGVPIGRTAQVETEFGEPVGWVPDEPIDEADEPSVLCRCGRSGSKPFCDGTHRSVGFDGTETADRSTIAARRRDVAAGEGTVSYDASTCEHAGFCADRFTAWQRLAHQAADPAVRERLMQMVRLCPSGALEMRPDPGGEQLEPALPVSIGVVRDGPIWVRGGIRIVGADGVAYEVRNRVTLCRCGRSENKPFCDGTHRLVGFRDG